MTVTVEDRKFTLDFPSRPPAPSDVPRITPDAFQVEPFEVLKSLDYLLVFENEDFIRLLKPNQALLNQINLDLGGVIVTAPGREVDFVSRFCAPQARLFEDAVTGSAHCSLIPYWRKRLKKQSMLALQLSPRGGKLMCRDLGDRVHISGEAVTYREGSITIGFKNE